jgi:hypothetical protein
MLQGAFTPIIIRISEFNPVVHHWDPNPGRQMSNVCHTVQTVWPSSALATFCYLQALGSTYLREPLGIEDSFLIITFLPLTLLQPSVCYKGWERRLSRIKGSLDLRRILFRLPTKRNICKYWLPRFVPGQKFFKRRESCLSTITTVQQQSFYVSMGEHRKTFYVIKNSVFWDVTPCGSCKNRRFGGT